MNASSREYPPKDGSDKPLEDGHAPESAVTDNALSRSPVLEAEQGARIHSGDGAVHVVIPRQQTQNGTGRSSARFRHFRRTKP